MKNSKMARARALITTLLARGPRASKDVFAAARRAGIERHVMTNTCRQIGVRVEKHTWRALPGGLREVEAVGTTIRRLTGDDGARKPPKKTLADAPSAAYVVLVDAEGVELARCAGIEGAHALGRVTPRAVAIVASDGRVLAGDDQGVARLAARRWVERARQDPRGVAASSADATGNGAGGTCGSARQGSSVAGSASPGEAA